MIKIWLHVLNNMNGPYTISNISYYVVFVHTGKESKLRHLKNISAATSHTMSWWFSNKPKLLESAEFSIIKDLNIITNNVLGGGSYGTVCAAVYDGKPCVAKLIHNFHTKQIYPGGPTPLEQCFKEINTLSSLRHPSIVQFLGVYFQNKSDIPILVMERLWNSLSDVLDQQPNQLPLLIKTHILYDVACGLQYLHGQKKPVVHRDLNSNNILLTENLDAKIADLGQARVLDVIAGQTFTRTPGNEHHMSPEAFDQKPIYDSKLDMFSFGCVVIHTVTEQFPEPTEEFVVSPNGQNTYVKQSEVDRRRKFIDLMVNRSALLHAIALECLKNEPSKRLSASEVCSKLEKHLEELTEESPKLAEQCKKGKLHLMKLVHLQEDELENKKKRTNELLKRRSILKAKYKLCSWN